MFNKILIANRGEIACRVMKTAQRLGVSTVGVYSDADRHSKHTRMADQSVHIGGSTPLESYLRMERVLEAALKTGAQGIHPGYGFLSENPSFVELCEKEGVTFIGPPAKAMVQMASKSESKDIMIKAKVPVTPGYHGANQDPKYLLEEAKKINFPVMIKAVMGGGGKGMKISWGPEDFFDNLESAKRESMKSFKDDRVLIEKYITRPKHYEIQVMGDTHGNYVYLFERDCSIQRRHQKIIEEAPSALTPAQRKDMGEKAVAAAKAVGYVNAGTVEFLYDLDTKNFYFMEMNTRLQVEHPISEEITGVDLVEWQLKVASGQKLPKTQDQLKINGHAIEARIYSEDPFTFLPGRGTIDYYVEPKGARVDSGVLQGSDVGIFYDPMISKLVVWGEDRSIALQKLRKSLVDYKIGGLVTNIPFLRRVSFNKDFESFDYDLKLIEENLEELVPSGIKVSNTTVAALAYLKSFHVSAESKNHIPSDLVNFRVNHNTIRNLNLETTYAFSQNDAVHKTKGTLENLSGGCYRLECTSGISSDFTVELTSASTLLLTLGSDTETFHFYKSAGHTYIFDSENTCFRCENLHNLVERGHSEEAPSDRINSPMSGMVVQIRTKEEQAVKKGEIIAIVEAMKMEHVIRANFDFIAGKVLCSENKFIEAGQPLLMLKEITEVKHN